jgi:hypothetical protein
LEWLSNASFLGKLLVLPAKVRLDWKVIARYKHSCLFGLIISNEGKKFYNIGPRMNERQSFVAAYKDSKTELPSKGTLTSFGRKPFGQLTFEIPGNTKGGSITVPLTSSLNGLD